ncbi:unnamed protein product [Prorocentrum cordatum]|uniref:Uncharacterized protein n=1 Tax=Prorocentrum cordatum TaxID=2364126 RepID=A0ABN9T485_9DINO|nr:unnamed protein product [Polarella glacialis]
MMVREFMEERAWEAAGKRPAIIFLTHVKDMNILHTYWWNAQNKSGSQETVSIVGYAKVPKDSVPAVLATSGQRGISVERLSNSGARPMVEWCGGATPLVPARSCPPVRLPEEAEAEKSRLHSAEKRFGVVWDDLHAYKEDRMLYPTLPVMMSVDELPKEGTSPCARRPSAGLTAASSRA